MNRLEEIITELKKEMIDMSFAEVLREARDRIGLVQYRAAEHLGMTMARLKNLEIGYFRAMPSAEEMRNICDFYNLSYALMEEKAKKHCDERAIAKKVRTLKDG